MSLIRADEGLRVDANLTKHHQQWWCIRNAAEAPTRSSALTCPSSIAYRPVMSSVVETMHSSGSSSSAHVTVIVEFPSAAQLPLPLLNITT